MTSIQRSIAVVIGVNQYENGIPPLKTAVNDAKKLAKILETQYQYQVLSFLDTDATYAQLNHLLTALENQTLPLADGSTIQIQPDDQIFFYFAGHGIAADELGCSDIPTGYLVPQDAHLHLDNDDSLLTMQRLHDALLKLSCRHLLVILDCCFAGAIHWAEKREVIKRSTMYRERYERFMCGCAQQVITSAASDERAADSLYRLGHRNENSEHSPFAQLLFNALMGEADFCKDGVMTATEIYVYIHSQLSQLTAKQTPCFYQLKNHDKGEYIFAVPEFDPNNLESAPALSESTNPYRGLESFEEQHSKLFFGRKSLIQKLEKCVTKHPLTVVLGSSGAGKSSLVKAGLIPQLKLGDKQWRILAPIRPGEAPFKALNKTLEKEKMPVFTDNPNAFEQELQTLVHSVKAWTQVHPEMMLLLVIDQFEELITLCHVEHERIKFLNGLAKAIKAFPEQLRIVVTLRSDFETQFPDQLLEPNEQFPDKPLEPCDPKRFIISAMTREELRSVIVKPAAEKALYFDPPTLVDRLIDEVVQMPGALPLLSFTLSELYLKYIKNVKKGETSDRVITIKDYNKLGGVTRSLTHRADRECEKLVELDPAYEQTIKRVMLRMVAVGTSELARRRVLYSELNYPEPEQTRVNLVIERFAAARLLVKGKDIEGNPYIEPAHDALVRGWPKLRQWRDHELNFVRLQP
ncbi:MAG: caspase family protein [Rhizonema sp. PD38]|nr:caspase family protein [Rhizonema sp. PD38]